MLKKIPMIVVLLVLFATSGVGADSSPTNTPAPYKTVSVAGQMDKGTPAQAAPVKATASPESKKKPAGQAKAVPAKKRPIPDPNRRWIMKQRDHTGKKLVPKKVQPLKWKSSVQKRSCLAKEKTLAVTFDKARFYSIQGDRCQTARYAKAFLESAQDCQKGCPEKFLESRGYSDQVLRNMYQLKALGTRSCLGR